MKEFLEKADKRVLGLIRLALRRAPPWLFLPRNKYIKNCTRTTSRSPPPSPAVPVPHFQRYWTSRRDGMPAGLSPGGAPPSPWPDAIDSFPLGVTERWQAGPSVPQTVVNGWIKTLQGFFQSRMCTGNKFRKSCFLLQEMDPPPTGRNYSGSSKDKCWFLCVFQTLTLPRPARFYWYRISKVGF